MRGWGSIQEWGFNGADTVIILEYFDLTFRNLFLESDDRYSKDSIEKFKMRKVDASLLEVNFNFLFFEQPGEIKKTKVVHF